MIWDLAGVPLYEMLDGRSAAPEYLDMDVRPRSDVWEASKPGAESTRMAAALGVTRE